MFCRFAALTGKLCWLVSIKFLTRSKPTVNKVLDHAN